MFPAEKSPAQHDTVTEGHRDARPNSAIGNAAVAAMSDTHHGLFLTDLKALSLKPSAIKTHRQRIEQDTPSSMLCVYPEVPMD